MPKEGGTKEKMGETDRIEAVHITLMVEALLGMAKARGIDPSLIERAYRTAREAHGDQKRDEGTIYIGHPVRVAAILFGEVGIQDPDVIAAALLHDTLEDTPLDDEALRAQFGPRIAEIVRFVTKREETSPAEEAEIDRAYLQGIREASDPGVALVKLADRLDNVRCMQFNPRPEKRAKYIRKTEALYLPLAREKSEYLAHAITEGIEKLKEIG